MLRELQIKNFAVIDAIEIKFGAGLNIITGETGAGKSILLNALNLIAGERGSTDVIRHKADEATVEALFDELPESLLAQLAEQSAAQVLGLIAAGQAGQARELLDNQRAGIRGELITGVLYVLLAWFTAGEGAARSWLIPAWASSAAPSFACSP